MHVAKWPIGLKRAKYNNPSTQDVESVKKRLVLVYVDLTVSRNHS